MRIVVTGAHGFLGWHLRCRLRARTDFEVVPVDRAGLDHLDEAMLGADAVVHLAGVNRGPAARVVGDNMSLAHAVAAAVRRAKRPMRVVFANSTQAGNGSPYGDGKAGAEVVLRAVAAETGSSFVDVRLPNVFGEHGRPDYNSFVATFCRDVAAGFRPAVTDRELTLLHAQRAAQALIDATGPRVHTDTLLPPGEQSSVGEVLAALEEFHQLYQRGDIPPLHTAFHTDLFNTYRAAVFPGNSPIGLPSRGDRRGSLVECVRAHGQGGQTFVSTTVAGVTRGEHFHLRKVERFVVLHGAAQIALRRMFSTDTVRISVTGDDVVAVDMPTMWAHSITNVGSSDLITLFWTDSVFDPARADTYAETVEQSPAHRRAGESDVRRLEAVS